MRMCAESQRTHTPNAWSVWFRLIVKQFLACLFIHFGCQLYFCSVEVLFRSRCVLSVMFHQCWYILYARILTIFPCVIPSTVDNTKCEAGLHSFFFIHPSPITIYNPNHSHFPCVDEVLKDKITQTKPKKTLSVLLLFFFLLSNFALSLPVKPHVKSVRWNPVFIAKCAPCWFLEEIQISHHFSSSLPDRQLIRCWRQWREQLPPERTQSASHTLDF